MNQDLSIVGDWGTTRLRLSLCAGDQILDTRSGPGIGALIDTPSRTVSRLAAAWIAIHGPLPIVLCGMAGSREGWREAAYIACPADAGRLRAGVLRFEDEGMSVAIVPGLTCTNRLDVPDVMRGEETQIVGALALRPSLSRGRHVLCLPGTHTKWATVEDGCIRDFLTATTGELFALLRDHSILARAASSRSRSSFGTSPSRGFDRALALHDAGTGAPWLHALFGARSCQLLEGASREWALEFVSGLLVGADVSGAASLLGGIAEVTLVGDPHLTALYARALRAREIRFLALDGAECSRAGLRSIATNHEARAHEMAR